MIASRCAPSETAKPTKTRPAFLMAKEHLPNLCPGPQGIVICAAIVVSLMAGQPAVSGGCSGGSSAESAAGITKVESRTTTNRLTGFSEFTYRGGWSSSASYKSGDSVLFNGAFWVSQSDSTSVTPTINGSAWKISAVTMYRRFTEYYIGSHEGKWIGTGGPDHWQAWDHWTNMTRTTLVDDVGNSSSTVYGGEEVRHSWGASSDYKTTYTWQADGSVSYLTKYINPPSPDKSGNLSWFDPYEYSRAIDPPWGLPPEDLWGTLSFEQIVEPKRRAEVSDAEFPQDVAPGWFEEDRVRLEQIWELSIEAPLVSEPVGEWEPAPTAHSWLGSWTAGYMTFTSTGVEVRFWCEFDCLPEDAEVEFVYHVWPVGGTEAENRVEEIDTKSVSELSVKKTEEGRSEIEETIIAKDGYHKRLVKARLKTSCSDDGGFADAGNSNGGSLGSVSWWVSLGKEPGGASVGNLRIQLPELGPQSAKPGSVRIDAPDRSNLTIIEDRLRAPRQIKAPECFVDIVMIDEQKFEICFYPLSAIVADVDPLTTAIEETDPLTGLFVLTADAEPFSVWTIENPDGSGASNRLRIAQTLGGGAQEYLYTHEASGDWSLLRNGISEERLSTSQINATDHEEIRTVEVPNEPAAPTTARTYRLYPFGERLIREVIDPDGAALTTEWVYYDSQSSDGAAFGQLKSIAMADGSWERFEYDSEGRKWKTISGWLDAPFGASENQCRVETILRAPDGLSATITETIAGQEVGRRYWERSPTNDFVRDIVCTSPGAAIDDPDNLITLTRYVVGGEFDGEVANIKQPDGTLTLHTYERSPEGVETHTVARGEPNANDTAVVSGTLRQTVIDSLGRENEEILKDIASGLVIESWIVMERDAQSRPTLVAFSDGTTERKFYGCCGVENETGRDEITLSRTFDDLGRVESETRLGITTIFKSDAQGRVRSSTRKGTDGTEIVTQESGFDDAGRLDWSKDGRGKTTDYSESTDSQGRTVKTTTLPDGIGQIVEVYHRDGQLESVSGSAAHPRRYEYGVAPDGLRFTKEIRIGEEGAETEWTKTFTDPAGRVVRVEYPGGAEESTHYNSLGQMDSQEDADGVVTLYTYNSLEQLRETAVDADKNGVISNLDRRTRTTRSVVAGPLNRTVDERGTDEGYVVDSMIDTSPNGRYQKQTVFGLDTVTTSVFDGDGNQTTTTTHPDGSTTTQELTQGMLLSTTRRDAGGTVIDSTVLQYDPHGRLWKSTDGRLGTETVYAYNDADQIVSVTNGGLVTTYTPDALGRIVTQTLPGSDRVITRSFNGTGELLSESGSATYPVSYTYDPQGRMRTMTTATGGTQWIYNPARGWLVEKRDAANLPTTYTHTDAGRLKTRTWARGVVTTYGYNPAGELDSVAYSDGTPSVAITRDAAGQAKKITDAASTRTLSYQPNGALTSESVTGNTPWSGLSIENGFDALQRRNTVTASRSGSVLSSVTHTFDDASRLETLTSGDGQTATYGYHPKSSLVNNVVFGNSAGMAMTLHREFDGLDRPAAISANPASGPAVSYSSLYNSHGQRERATLADGTYWEYGYNSRGEVTGGTKHLAAATPLNGYEFGYDFDGIGNRLTTQRNGRSAAYFPNALNQYTSRTVPGFVTLLGSAKPEATVDVNGSVADRQGKFFHNELPADNATTPAYLSTTVNATLGPDTATQTGQIFVAQSPESFDHDDDGNLLSDGRWNYSWDGENRLVGMETTAAAAANAGAARVRMTFTYDYQSRRIGKKVEHWQSGTFQHHHTTIFLYDGWNLVPTCIG